MSRIRSNNMSKTLSKKNSILNRLLLWMANNKRITLIIILGGITNLGVIFFNGSEYCVKQVCGMYIGGLHFHDSLWHLALANSAFQSFPFQLPIFAGVPLQGYNYFLDFIIFLLTKIGISAIVSYFKLIPVLFFILFSYLSYIYAKKTNKSPIFILCFLFFIYFGSSFSYILSLYHSKTIWSYFYAQAMQSGRMLLNLQYAVSLIPFLGVLILLKNKKLPLFQIFILCLLLFLTTGFKLYGGIILLFLIAVDFLIRLVLEKKCILWILNGILIAFAFALSILVFYDPFLATKSGAAFVFSPFALTRPMIEAADHFYMPQLVQARYYLQAIAPHSPRLFAIELLSVGLFIFLNCGTRLVGLFYVVQALFRNKLNKDEVVLIAAIIFSTVLTVSLVQKGTWWNVVQFYGYTLFLMNYFAAAFVTKIFSSKKIPTIIFGIIIIILTLPTNIEQIRFAYERNISITRMELNGLEKLRSVPTGVVLSLPLQDTAYISAFSGKQQYVADEGVLTIIGIDPRERISSLKNMKPIDISPRIKYIYINKKNYTTYTETRGFHPIFENAEVRIEERD